MTNQVIPAAAVEAARRALECALGYGFDGISEVRAALESAIPPLLANAWDEGIEAGVDGSVPECDYARNPYRATTITEALEAAAPHLT